MDNLELMLRQAPEIQEGWVPKDGDVTDKGIFVGYCMPFGTATSPKEFLKVKKFPKHKFEGYGNSYFKKDLLWLPTSDDLLGMVDDVPWILTSTGAVSSMYKFQIITCSEYWLSQYKMVAILKGIMQEKFKKRWTGEGWE